MSYFRGVMDMVAILKRKKVPVIIIVALILVASAVTAVLASTPGITAVTPADGAVVTAASTTISFTVADPDLISDKPGDYYIKVNGSPVTAAVQFRGYWTTDSCTGASYYIVTGYDQATISGTVSGLKDGPQNVEVRAADRLGNPVGKTWTFTVSLKPVFSSMYPADGSSTGDNTKVSVKVADDTQVDPASITMTVDGASVQPAFDPATGVISYTAQPSLADGIHNVTVTARDTSGNQGAVSWKFNTGTTGPNVTTYTPAAGAVIVSPNTTISFTVTDLDLIANSDYYVKLNGNTVNSSLQYPGHTLTDSCSGAVTYIIDRYDQATITASATGLKDGIQTIEVQAADRLGNKTVKKWEFAVAVKPAFSGMSPVNGYQSKAVSGVSVKVSDNSAVDPNRITLTIDKAVVAHVYDANTGTITYTGGFADGSHTVEAAAYDIAGNLGTATWSFTVDNAAPAVKLYPYGVLVNDPVYRGSHYVYRNLTDKITDDGMVHFRGELNDLVDITPDTVLILDGQAVSADIRYDGQADTCTGAWIVRSKKKVYVNYDGVLSDGNHTISLTKTDILGNTSTETWNLVVETRPAITEWKPVTYISEFKPVISAKIKDVNTGIDPAAIKMVLDGQGVDFSYDEATGLVSYTPASPLANESYHTVALGVYDKGGLYSALTWKFNINTYPDMADSNIINCISCHAAPESLYSRGTFETVHYRKLSFGGRHSSNDCINCHNYITQPAQCGQCHGFDTEIADGSGPHGTSVGVKYGLLQPDPYSPIRVTANREMWDCVICHQPGSNVQKGYGYTTSFVPQNNHDIPELHKVEASTCNDCHARSLTREHAREGRVDASGLPITCSTCHMNADPKVKNAIASHDKNCTTCHGQAGHSGLHNSGLDANCQTCHDKSLDSEHLSSATTAGKNFSCNTCHTSTGKLVKRTISSNRLNCTGCHIQGHNISFADSVPADIPLHPDFRWTTPMEASLFAGESGVPVGYELGQVTVSNRRADINAGQVWTFYSEKLTANGWTMKSPAPAPGTSFVAQFVYGQTRAVTVKCFNTANSDGTGEAVGAGYRIELWYK